ncbi:F-box protein skip28 [Phtheirospermum japonicum]|uniref:F-box protein skip28 n=1 Tax=Phtheirospermum japonicum TaxID=374723 RepID=A0A830B8W4_9LAMI|nr:F-box protein skip28 [Phtheirospermum japonicum]
MADDKEGSSPNEAIFFVLAYLPVFELLAMAQVCKSLRDAINNDILPWLKIVVDRPLNWRISDEILVKIASKAKGRLQVLALINCVKITDDALLSVIAQNPHITKLHVPNCTSLSPEGVVNAVKLLSKNNHMLKTLQINGVYGINNQQLETLHTLIINQSQQHNRGKILYHEHTKLSTLDHISNDDHRSIDVDTCPVCNEVKMVFDCPQMPCQRLQHREINSECKGCESCVARCVECGVCVTNTQDLEEALCSDTLCSDCWLKLPKCDFCNKPYCNKHADRQERVSESMVGFVCATCNADILLKSYDSFL